MKAPISCRPMHMFEFLLQKISKAMLRLNPNPIPLNPMLRWACIASLMECGSF